MIQAIDPALFLPPEALKSADKGRDQAGRPAAQTDEAAASSSTLLEMTMRSDRVDFSAQSQDAFLKGYRESMHVDAKMRIGDSLWDISIDVQREVIMQGTAATPQEFQQGLLDILPEDVRKKIEGYLAEGGLPEALSPDRVSQNIVDFALGGYGTFLNAGQDGSGARQEFLDFIVPYIDKGFKEALEILEPFLTDKARGVVDETRNLVGDKMNAWRDLATDITA